MNAADLKRYTDKLAVNTNFREDLLDDLKNHRCLVPSHYMCKILQLSITEMNKFFHSSNLVDEMSSRFLTSSICIFVDAFDQTLTERFEGSLNVWKNAQIGLIYAAHRIRNSNKHIKVFASIRHEAWASFYSDDRQVIKGQALVLDHSKHELKQMFLHGVKKYTSQNTIEKFLGLDTILFFESAHPFCELLNVGVLGAVKRNPVTNKNIQHFRKPQEFDWKMQNILNQDQTYLIHPSLHESILLNRGGHHYYVNPINIIGEGLEWDDTARVFPQVHISYPPSNKLPRPLQDLPLVYLMGQYDELDESINALTATMALCLKSFWQLGD